RSHVDHIVNTLTGNSNAEHIERFAINLTVHGVGKQLPETTTSHITRSQLNFFAVLTSSAIVVLLSENTKIVLRVRWGGSDKHQTQHRQCRREDRSSAHRCLSLTDFRTSERC